MKIKITYEKESELFEALRKPLQSYIDDGAKLRKSDNYAPYKHAYLNIKKSEKNDKTKSPA